MVIEEKDLSGLGGWDCYKKARTCLATGSVLKSSKTVLKDGHGSILFTGLVLEGKKKYVCGLKFRSIEDADNLCRCNRAIAAGSVCVSVALLAAPLDVGQMMSMLTCQFMEAFFHLLIAGERIPP